MPIKLTNIIFQKIYVFKTIGLVSSIKFLIEGFLSVEVSWNSIVLVFDKLQDVFESQGMPKGPIVMVVLSIVNLVVFEHYWLDSIEQSLNRQFFFSQTFAENLFLYDRRGISTVIRYDWVTDSFVHIWKMLVCILQFNLFKLRTSFIFHNIAKCRKHWINSLASIYLSYLRWSEIQVIFFSSQVVLKRCLSQLRSAPVNYLSYLRWWRQKITIT